jgi:hypothetical protein
MKSLNHRILLMVESRICLINPARISGCQTGQVFSLLSIWYWLDVAYR